MASSKVAGAAYQQTWFHGLVALAFVGMAVVATFEMRLREPIPGFQVAFEKAVESGNCAGKPVLSQYTGIKPVDTGLKFLVTAFLPGTVGIDKGFQIMQAYFLVGFFPVIATWCVESGREGNRWSMISFPAVWAIFYQTVGGAIIIPSYYLAYMYTSWRRRNYFSATSMAVSDAFAQALLPSLLIGYLLPTVLLYPPTEMWDDATHQMLIALWQPCPFFVSLFLAVNTWGFSDESSASKSGDKVSAQGNLRTLYAVCFAVTGLWHIGTFLYCFTSTEPEASLAAAFDLRILLDSPLIGSLKYIFQVDLWVIMIASLLWAYLAVYDMKRAGNTSVGMIQALVYFVVGTVFLGPAAVLSATWYWREGLLHKTKTS